MFVRSNDILHRNSKLYRNVCSWGWLFVYSVIIICLHSIIQNQVTNPGGWTWQTYRQGSAELGTSEQPKKHFATNRKPKRKYFPKSKTLKNALKNTIHFAKVKHNMIIMETRRKLPGEWIFCRVPFTHDMHQKNLFLVTSIFRTRSWMFESKF